MVTIYIYAQATKHPFERVDTVEEAIEYCSHYNWKWLDENCFDWVMDYEVDDEDEYEEPYDLEMGFDPYEGCYTYDC